MKLWVTRHSQTQTLKTCSLNLQLSRLIKSPSLFKVAPIFSTSAPSVCFCQPNPVYFSSWETNLFIYKPCLYRSKNTNFILTIILHDWLIYEIAPRPQRQLVPWNSFHLFHPQSACGLTPSLSLLICQFFSNTLAFEFT